MSRDKSAVVTDHAVLNYLGRVCGIDTARIRRRIWEQARQGPENGKRTVNGITFVRREGAVVTVIAAAHPEPAALDGS